MTPLTPSAGLFPSFNENPPSPPLWLFQDDAAPPSDVHSPAPTQSVATTHRLATECLSLLATYRATSHTPLPPLLPSHFDSSLAPAPYEPLWREVPTQSALGGRSKCKLEQNRRTAFAQRRATRAMDTALMADLPLEIRATFASRIQRVPLDKSASPEVLSAQRRERNRQSARDSRARRRALRLVALEHLPRGRVAAIQELGIKARNEARQALALDER
jgi:hypothetical protein